MFPDFGRHGRWVARAGLETRRHSIPDLTDKATTLAPEAELASPIAARMVFRGKHDLRVLLGAVNGSLRGLRWDKEIGDKTSRGLIGAAKVGGVSLGDAMMFELAEDALIRRIRPHLRPWLGLTVFTFVVGPKLARHPGVIWRALRRGR